MTISNSSYRIFFISALVIIFAIGAGIAIGLDFWWVGVLLIGMILTPFLLGQVSLLLKIVTFLAPLVWLPLIPANIFETARDIWFILFFILGGLTILNRNDLVKELKKHHEVRFLYLILVGLSVGVIFSSSLINSGLVWLKSLQVVIFYSLLVVIIRDKDEVWSLLNIFLLGQLLSVFILLLVNIFPSFGGLIGDSGVSSYGLGAATTSFSNTTAHVLPIAFTGLLFGPKKFRLVYLFATISLYTAIIISGGRAGLFASVLVFGLLMWKLWSSNTLAKVLLFIGIGFVIFISASGSYTDILSTNFEQVVVRSTTWVDEATGLERYDRMSSFRLSAYSYAIGLLLKYPLTGVGLGNYREFAVEAHGFVSELGLAEQHIASSAHNLYLDVGSEAGIIPSLLVLGFMIWAVVKALRVVHLASYENYFLIACGTVIFAQFITSWFEVEVFWSIYRAFPFWLALTGITKWEWENIKSE